MYLRFNRRNTSKTNILKHYLDKNLAGTYPTSCIVKNNFQEVTIIDRKIEFLLSLISYCYKLLMKDNYHKGNLENKISMVLFWIYLFAVAIIFIRGLILFVSK